MACKAPRPYTVGRLVSYLLGKRGLGALRVFIPFRVANLFDPKNESCFTHSKRALSVDRRYIVVDAFIRPFQKLDAGCEMYFNGEIGKICAYNIRFLGDMPQQANNSRFLRHTAIHGCRTCLCPKTSKGNLQYDVVKHGRGTI